MSDTEQARSYDSKGFGASAKKLISGIPNGRAKFLEEMEEQGGPSSPSFFDRLGRGNMRMEVAIVVRKALKAIGADISKLPPLDEPEPVMSDAEMVWMSRWMLFGRIMWNHLRGSPAFEERVADLERLTQPFREVHTAEVRAERALADALHPTKR